MSQIIEVIAPKQVEVTLRADGKVLWVNVDGVCRLRIGQIVPGTVELRGFDNGT